MSTFEQSTGKLFDASGKFLAKGYAGGNDGKNPEGVNNPNMQDVKSIGPLPQGTYTFGVAVDHSTLGAFAIPLIPDSDNEMFGRGHFYMHGDTTPSGNASEGCIIMPPAIRHQLYNSDDKTVIVVETV